MRYFVRASHLISLALLLAAQGFSQSTIAVNQSGIITTYAKLRGFISGMAATTQPVGSVWGIAVAQDRRGGFYIATPEDNRLYRVFGDGRIVIAAGSPDGYSGESGDGGPANLAMLNGPYGVATDSKGNVFIADTYNGRIRRIDTNGTITSYLDIPYPRSLAMDSADALYIGVLPSRVVKITAEGVLTPVAGTGISGFAGDGGPAVAALISDPPGGLALDGAGNLYIADYSNQRIRKVSPNGIISTVAGNGTTPVGPYIPKNDVPATSVPLFYPVGVTVDASGTLYFGDSSSQIRKVTADGIIRAFAGKPGDFSGDGGQAALASFIKPYSLAFDAVGNLYLGDEEQRRVRRITTAGIINTVAGNGGGSKASPQHVAIDASNNLYVAGLLPNMVHKIPPNGTPVAFGGSGTAGFFGDGGAATNAWLKSPQGMAIDKSGSLYVADTNNQRIRKITPDGLITTVAGTGVIGFNGDGRAATSTWLNFPSAVAVDASGNLYIADTTNNRIRKVDPSGIISTVAGNGQAGYTGDGSGTDVALFKPVDITIDGSGALLIADSGNNRIRKLTPDGVLTTIAGNGIAGFSGDGAATSISLSNPEGVSADALGNIYVSDTWNGRIRKVAATGIVTTIAGSFPGYSGDGGPAASAQLYEPAGLTLDHAGFLYVTDSYVGNVRRIALADSAAFSIAVSGTVSLQTTGTKSQPSVGFVKVDTYGGTRQPVGLSVLSLRNKDNVLLSETSIPAVPAISSGRFYVEISAGVNTALSISNPAAETAAVQFVFSDASGDVNPGAISIPPNRQVSAFLSEPPFNAAASFTGTFSFASSVPVVVAALRSVINARSEFIFSNIPLIDPASISPRDTLWIPHFAAGVDWTTDIVLVNPSDVSTAINIQFDDQQGMKVPVEVNGQDADRFAYSVPPRAALKLVVAPLEASASLVRKVEISAALPFVPLPYAFAIFSNLPGGTVVSESIVAATGAASAVPVYGQISGNFATGAADSVETALAIANITESAAAIEIVGEVDSSTTQREGTLSIPPNGQVALFLDQVPGFGAEPFEGILQVQSSNPVSVIAVRGHYNERGELLLSGIPPVPDPLPLNIPFFFPYFADSGGFTTRFTLFNFGSSAASSGILTFVPGKQ